MPSRLKRLMAKGVVAAPGAYNAATAMLAEKAGFKAVYVSGAGLANSCGLPDTGLLSIEETAVFASYIIKSTALPAIVDVDTGFGGPGKVSETVRVFESIGAAAVQIEDQEFPKRCGHLEGKRVMPAKEFARKIRAAVADRKGGGMLIIARTDARACEGLASAMERARIYLDAGADMVFPEALLGKAEFREFASCVKAPLLANMTEFGKSPYLSVREFGEMGYAVVIFPMTCFRAAMKAAGAALAELKTRGTQKRMLDKMQTRDELYRLLGYSPEAKTKKGKGNICR
ncbi:MAG: methylisocitrate lyase [Deltaproteobacteria bacterium]|nr:methylisocitrate lyase [Deltaproteobacteria bacterium]